MNPNPYQTLIAPDTSVLLLQFYCVVAKLLSPFSAIQVMGSFGCLSQITNGPGNFSCLRLEALNTEAKSESP